VKFGRVEGFIQLTAEDELHLIVTLESGSGISTVRDEIVDPPVAIDATDLYWLADQYTQETIGHHLAIEGWEPIGAGDPPERTEDAPARSSTYAVRNLSQG
jgi:hypothetical protein